MVDGYNVKVSISFIKVPRFPEPAAVAMRFPAWRQAG